MPLSEATKKQIDDVVHGSDVVLFMKGSRQFPQCGFSSQVVKILDGIGAPYATVNVLADPSIRDGIKEYSQWPTIPQLYVKGEFVGGCDIVKEMQADGELQKLLAGARPPAAVAKAAPAAPVKLPTIHLTAEAAEAIKAADEPGSTDVLHFSVSPSFAYDLSFGPREPGDVEVVASGVTILIDAASVQRADGTSISFVDGDGGGFKIVNPNAPAAVRQIQPTDLAAMQKKAEKFELLDVRTPGERAIAQIPGAVLLDEEVRARLETLDRSTPLVFHCHHGGRSQQAAEHFLKKGFRDVSNVRGGIDAWSQTVDPKVPRY